MNWLNTISLTALCPGSAAALVSEPGAAAEPSLMTAVPAGVGAPAPPAF
jgi:hypothetical protein